jgi:hypothetical protein
MTQADVPSIATAGLFPRPVNPFTNKPLDTHKQDGATITTSPVLNFAILPTEWLHVHDDIFNPRNWEKIQSTTSP